MSILRFLCVLLLVAVSGCTIKGSTSGTTNDGVEYEFPIIEGKSQESDTKDNGYLYATKGLEVRIVKGNLQVNKKSYGEIKSGDKLKVSADGAVEVNGKERKPSGKATD